MDFLNLRKNESHFINEIKVFFALMILHRRNSTICQAELLLIFFDFFDKDKVM